jgi:triacylglycerol lipase
MVKHFDPGAHSYSSMNAFWLGQAARLAYRDPAIIEATTATWEFQQFRFFDQAATQAFLLGSADLIILAFRGTQMRCMRDWMTDFQIAMIPGCGGKIHRGFSKALDLIWDQVMTELGRCRSNHQALFLTGHSLGAGLATIAAARLQEAGQPVNSLYTFGSPRVGNRQFVDRFTQQLGSQTFRFVNDHDLITRLPPRSLGYGHVGLVLYFDQSGVLHLDFRYWQKFLETVKGGLDHVFEPGVDGIQDHDMEEYARNLALNVDQIVIPNGR